MIFIAVLLHIYQPPTQYPEVTKTIADSSYRLILKILNNTKAKLTLNIPASLSEQLVELKETDIIKGIRNLVAKKQLELTATAAYHPLLPRLPEEVIKRQIILNDKINKKIYGSKIYCPDGLFLPEMAYSSHLDRVLKGMGMEWVVLDELAYDYDFGRVKHDVVYIKQQLNNKNNISGYDKKELKIFFRDDRLSNAIAMSGVVNIAQFDKLLDSRRKEKDEYFVLSMDGETFGHHQLGQDKLLSDILTNNKYNIVFVSELEKYFRKKEYISPLISCWGVSHDDLRKKTYWPRWSYPGNKIHELQWELTKLAIFHQTYKNNRPTIFDKSLHSDQYWWASAKPYWHPDMIRRGANLLLQSVLDNPKNSSSLKNEAKSIYNDILEEVLKKGEKIIN